MLGCSKQNISYWEKHPFSTQSKKSVLKVIGNAAVLFCLSEKEKEVLANKAGLSFCGRGSGLTQELSKYAGKFKTLYASALITERMFRYYKTSAQPPKQALLALAVVLGLPISEIEALLWGYGYFLSHSLIGDVVVLWFLSQEEYADNRLELLYEANQTLQDMELPLLATRMNGI